MNSFLKIAVMLTAYDAMSRTIRDGVQKSKKELDDLKKHSVNLFAQGAGLMGAGAVGFNALGKTIADFELLEESAVGLKSVMMQDGGVLNTKQFAEMNKLASELGNRLPGNTADFNNMFSTMVRSGVDANNIINGTGEAAAYLAVALKLPYEEAGRMAAKLKEATGIGRKDMVSFMDVIARTSNLGVQADEMSYAFARSAGTLKLMNIQGLENSKTISAVYAMLIKTGASGETVGTGMSAVFNSFANPAKMEKLNAEASKFGIAMEFMDKKTGQFKGVENMMIQFDKLKNLNTTQRAGIVQAFLGPGADANFMNTLISQGVEGFNKTSEAMARQATLSAKVAEVTASLKAKKEAMNGTIENMNAALGATLAPLLGRIYDLLGRVAAAVQRFVENNPKIAKLIMLMIAFTSAALMIAGVIRIVQGIIAVFKILNIVMAMNPFILLAMIAIAAVALIITFWDEIKTFFIELWEKLKAIFKQAAKDIIKILMHLNPYTLIYLYWADISAFFIRVWAKVGNIFSSFLVRVKGIGKEFFNAGRNIAVQIWEGIKSMANKPVETISNMVKSMREYLPFSPAKRGPFRDLHRIKIIETIASSMKSSPLVQKMQGILGEALGVKASNSISGGSGGGGGGVTIHYSPVIHLGAGASKEEFLQILRGHKEEIYKMVTDVGARKKAISF